MQKLGEFELSRVVESEVPFIEPEVFLPDFTSDVLEANVDWLCPQYIDAASGRLIFAFQSYILRTPRHVILVDTCVGNNKSRPARPMWHMQNGPYLTDLAAAGVQPEQVDFVLCTHLHVDHAGWNTQLIDGRWVPTFPNARYIFARKEHDFWERRYHKGIEGSVPNIYEDSVLPVMEAGQAVLVDMDHQIDDGVWFEPAPGHTEGNIVINLRSGDATGVLSGDVMHHPLQLVRPEWSSRACEDHALSAVTRQAFIERYADTDTLIAPAHFASPSMGRIHRKGEAFGYRLAEEM